MLVERTTESGVRLGIVGLIDLDDYDFDPKMCIRDRLYPTYKKYDNNGRSPAGYRISEYKSPDNDKEHCNYCDNKAEHSGY